MSHPAQDEPHPEYSTESGSPAETTPPATAPGGTTPYPAPAPGTPAPSFSPAPGTAPAPGYGAVPHYAPAPGYGPPPGYAEGVRAPVPGRTLGIVGFVLSFLGPLSVGGLVVSIIALVQSRRVKAKNGLALAGIIISTIAILCFIALVILILVAAGSISHACTGLPSGTILTTTNAGTIRCP